MKLTVLNDFSLTKNFRISEFVCPDGTGEVMINMDQVNKLQKLRDLAKSSINIVSGYRNAAYNKKIGGDPYSNHMKARATDIHIVGLTPEQIAPLAVKAGFTRIIIYDTWVHVGNTLPMLYKDSRVKNISKPIVWE